MENQHRKISGYRELTQEEIDLMNEIKALGPQIEIVVNKVRDHIRNQRDNAQPDSIEDERLDAATPEHFHELSKFTLQTGLMYLTRAVAQPTFF